MKKILHITIGNPFGGLDKIVEILLKNLGEFSNKVIYWEKESIEIFKGIKKTKTVGLRFKGNNIFVNLFKYVKDLNASDIIHVHNVDPWILFSPMLFYKNKTIYSLHGNFGYNIKKNIFIC